MMIRRAAVNAMLNHAGDALPNECCGLLLGTPGTIEEATRATNVSPSPHRYELDPRDHFEAIRRARRERRAIAGVYHSHPSAPAVPSLVDLAEATYPEYLYVIVSLLPEPAGDQIAAYRLGDQRFERVGLVVSEAGDDGNEYEGAGRSKGQDL